jgi:ferredoxin--NADP+ reductase
MVLALPTPAICNCRFSATAVHLIISKETLAPAVVRFWLEAPPVARKCRAGQFVILRLREGGERIPLTIAEADPARGTIAIVVQAVGKTTRELNAMDPGQAILDVAGPLGQPTHIEPGSRVCCIGGGIGAAVVLPIARALRQAGGTVVSILGARTRELVILEDEACALSERCIVTTDDGSYGRKGLVTDALREAIASSDRPFDEVIAIGPLPMMRAVCELTRPLGLKTVVSLNPVMVDGTGMCGGCRVSIRGEQKFVCVDGPEFDGHLVDFPELIARLSAYREQEQEALARYSASLHEASAT